MDRVGNVAAVVGGQIDHAFQHGAVAPRRGGADHGDVGREAVFGETVAVVVVVFIREEGIVGARRAGLAPGGGIGEGVGRGGQEKERIVAFAGVLRGDVEIVVRLRGPKGLPAAAGRDLDGGRVQFAVEDEGAGAIDDGLVVQIAGLVEGADAQDRAIDVEDDERVGGGAVDHPLGVAGGGAGVAGAGAGRTGDELHEAVDRRAAVVEMVVAGDHELHAVLFHDGHVLVADGFLLAVAAVGRIGRFVEKHDLPGFGGSGENAGEPSGARQVFGVERNDQGVGVFERIAQFVAGERERLAAGGEAVADVMVAGRPVERRGGKNRAHLREEVVVEIGIEAVVGHVADGKEQVGFGQREQVADGGVAAEMGVAEQADAEGGAGGLAGAEAGRRQRGSAAAHAVIVGRTGQQAGQRDFMLVTVAAAGGRAVVGREAVVDGAVGGDIRAPHDGGLVGEVAHLDIRAARQRGGCGGRGAGQHGQQNERNDGRTVEAFHAEFSLFPRTIWQAFATGLLPAEKIRPLFR